MHIDLFRKFRTLLYAIGGFIYKWLVDSGILKVPTLVGNNDNIVVSLTSYGRRVRSCVYYTLVSMLRQTVQPSRIILWLADDEWSDVILPEKLINLRGKNIEIRFCDDSRSYKKLIPTISLCPNSTIITIDDDMIYSSDTVQNLLNAHSKYPHDIICFDASFPNIENGIPKHYSLWKKCTHECSGKIIFPIGSGGILYPKEFLELDFIKDKVSLELCPFADDIWFWFCGVRGEYVKRFIKKRGIDLSFDSLYQFFHKGAALSHINHLEHQNDWQFKTLFCYYGGKIDIMGNFKKH